MNDVEMAPVNGVNHPAPAPIHDSPDVSTAAHIKRKRVDTNEAEERINGAVTKGTEKLTTTAVQDQINNLLVILRELVLLRAAM